MKMLRGIEEEANTGDVQDGKSTFTAAQNATSKSHASLCDSRCGRKTDKSYRPRSSYFSVGREFYDDGYSELDDEATIEDRMDFSTLKVRGRDQELLRLHEIYSFVHRGCRRETKVAIIKGLSGTGKSTLVKRFVEELEEQRNSTGSVRVPLFLHGKYDELVGTDPFSGIVEAFDRFANDLVSGKKEELERIRNAVHDQLGPEANTLVTIIPSLNAIMSNKGFPKGSKENARNKLKYVFQRFVSAISTETRPVIMFLDDLQWCDSASLELIQTLLMDADLQHFMFIGAYRKDEVQFDAELHSFLQMIDANQRLEQIDIGNLSKNELNLVVRDALQQENEDECMSLTEAIFNKTKGNIFHSIQVLQELQRKEILMFSRVTFQWEWQLNGVNLDDILSDDIIQAITDKISNCSKDLQRVLVLVAHTRFSIDVDTLQKLTDLNGPMIPSAGLLKILDEAVVDGILANSMGSRVYNFSHDRIQQAGRCNWNLLLAPNGVVTECCNVAPPRQHVPWFHQENLGMTCS